MKGKVKRIVISQIIISFVLLTISFNPLTIKAYHDCNDEVVLIDVHDLSQEMKDYMYERLNAITSYLLETTGLKSYDKEFLVLLAHEVNNLNVNIKASQRRNIIACCTEMKVVATEILKQIYWFNPYPSPGRWEVRWEYVTENICKNCGTVHR